MHKPSSLVTVGVVAFLLLAAPAAPARADAFIFGSSGSDAGNVLTVNGTTVLPFFDQGSYVEDGTHDVADRNYLVGLCDSCVLQGEYRNWFAFDIRRLRGSGSERMATPVLPVTSLVLTLNSFDVPLNGNYYLDDFTGSADSLLDGTAGVAGFDDLGGGTNLGFRFYQDTESAQYHDIELNAAALASLNDAIDQGLRFWAIGGFFIAGDTPLPPAVPEPDTALLMMVGVAGVAARRRLA